MEQKRTGNLRLFSSTGPLIQKTRFKDVDPKAELDSVGRNRNFPREPEAMRALRLRTEPMAVDPNPKVPDIDEEKDPF